MNESDWSVVETYPALYEAELAAGQLADRDIVTVR